MTKTKKANPCKQRGFRGYPNPTETCNLPAEPTATPHLQKLPLVTPRMRRAKGRRK